MAKVTYQILDTKLNTIPENETYSSSDMKLIDNFEVNRTFDFETNFIESHFYSINNEKLYSLYDYPLTIDADNLDLEDGSAGEIYIKPDELAVKEGFSNVDLKMVFHFLDDVYSADKNKETFFIQDIAGDRTELFLSSNNLDKNEIVSITKDLKEDLTEEGYFEELWLNFGDNDLYIVTNIDSLEINGKTGIAVKLYEPLPSKYSKKAVVHVVEKVSNSIAVTIDTEVEDDDIEVFSKLRQANFDVEVEGKNIAPTEYFNYNELFSFENNNSNREIYSFIKEDSVEINIDYSDYDNFINFSSANERIKNFRYKVRLLETYQSSLDSVNSITSGTSLSGIAELAVPYSGTSSTKAGSVSYYENLIEGVVNNFDHYERHLYYESGSTSWPKTTTNKPHTNLHSTSSEAVAWYAQQLTSASNYDTSNYDMLSNTLPSFLAEDSNNSNGVLFIHMIGQHFDNLWIYTKAVSNKYDADNRLDVGISKDLVQETLKSFGVKLYNSIESSDNLFKYLIGNTYDSGSYNEVINNYIEVSDLPVDAQPVSRKNYEGEVYKRLYHNMPFLMKTKGTERGLRALINCFGIPSDFLTIKQYGGQVVGASKFVGYENEVTSSLGKIRIESRASGSVGKVLTQDKSIQKKEVDRIKDVNRLEVGFSPSDSINKYILSQLPTSFNIDDYIGDPRELNNSSYFSLNKEAERVLLSSVGRFQLNDFVRILKFYDNVLFKMVRDFVPAKATVDAGIIIKPHILDRSKIKSPTITATEPNYSASIDTAFFTGSHGGAYYITQKVSPGHTLEASTAHELEFPTLLGTTLKPIGAEDPQYNGELSGSFITVSTGELNDGNVFKKENPPQLRYQIIATPLDVESLTQYSMYNVEKATPQLACAITPGQGSIISYYHNGTGTIPAAGDIIYTDSIGGSYLDGKDDWWSVPGTGKVLLVSGSTTPAHRGIVAFVQDCSAYDSTAPSGYTATWTNVPRYINASNTTAITAEIYNGEIGATFFASASNGSTLSANTATGTITSATQSVALNVGDLADGSNIVLNVRLVDAAGNSGSLATVSNGSGDTLTQSKDTSIPSGYTVRFMNALYSADQTNNTSGHFYIKIESLSGAGTVYYSLASTGGGNVSGQTAFNSAYATFKNISIPVNSHSMGTGTVTATVYAKDGFNNQGSNVTDTVTYAPQTGVITPSGISNLDGDGEGFTLGVNVTPNTLSWVITKPSWITISGASGVGDDSVINGFASVNGSNSNSRTGTIFLSTTGGASLDFITVTQLPSSFSGGQESQE
jgi:hypothetical protein